MAAALPVRRKSQLASRVTVQLKQFDSDGDHSSYILVLCEELQCDTGFHRAARKLQRGSQASTAERVS